MHQDKYRWIIAVLLFLGLLGLNVLWFILSPLLTVIMADLNLSLSQGGLVSSVVCLLVAVFSILGGLLLDRIGVKKAFLYGLACMAAGAIATYMVNSYTGLFATRVLIGIGFGLCLPVAGVVIMMWFDEKERPYMNTINSALPYAATVITFSLTIPMYIWFHHSWRLVIFCWGIFLALIALIWALRGKERQAGMNLQQEEAYEPDLYQTVWKNREVRLLSLAEACDMWSFQFLTSMLPTFFTVETGLTAATAARLTALFPLTGLAAGLVCGVWMTRAGVRKPFTWPMHIAIFAGTLLIISTTGWWRVLGIVLAGFGNAGWAPALFTMPMEFKDMTSSRVGAVYALMLALGFLAAFISPWLGGYLAQKISLHHTIFIFSFSSLLAAWLTFSMQETGPAARIKART